MEFNIGDKVYITFEKNHPFYNLPGKIVRISRILNEVDYKIEFRVPREEYQKRGISNISYLVVNETRVIPATELAQLIYGS